MGTDLTGHSNLIKFYRFDLSQIVTDLLSGSK